MVLDCGFRWICEGGEVQPRRVGCLASWLCKAVEYVTGQNLHFVLCESHSWHHVAGAIGLSNYSTAYYVDELFNLSQYQSVYSTTHFLNWLYSMRTVQYRTKRHISTIYAARAIMLVLTTRLRVSSMESFLLWQSGRALYVMANWVGSQSTLVPDSYRPWVCLVCAAIKRDTVGSWLTKYGSKVLYSTVQCCTVPVLGYQQYRPFYY